MATEPMALSRFQAELLDSVGHPIIAVDTLRTVIYWNHAAEEKYGWSAAEALGRSSLDLIARDETPAETRAISEVLLRGESWSGDYEVRRRDGSSVSVHVTNRPVFDDDGRMVAVIGSSVDASERRRLSAIVEGSGDAIFSATIEGRVTSWNPAAERLFGYSAEEMLGRSVEILTPPERLVERAEIYTRIGAGGAAERVETMRRRKDGTQVDVLLTVSPTAGDLDRLVGVSVIAQDITERREAQRALEVSQQQLADAQRIAQVGSVEFDVVHQTITRSDEYYRILGVPNAFEPNGGLMPSVLEPGDRASWAAAWAAAVDDGIAFDVAYRVVRDDGERWLRVRGAPETDCDVKVTKVTGTLSDETDRVEAEAVRIEAEAEGRRYERLCFAFLASLPVGVYIVAADGTPFYANEVARELLGSGIDPPAERSEWSTVYETVRAGTDEPYPAEEEPIALALAGRETHNDDTEVRRPGRAVPLEVWARPVHDDDGLVTFAMAVFVDISERRRAEDRVRFQAHLLDTAGQAIVATDRSGAITYWNPAADHVFGWTEAEVRGRRIGDVVPRQTTVIEAAHIRNALNTGESWTGDLPMHRRDGSAFTANATYTPMFDEAQRVVGTIVAITDATERRALEDRVNQGERLESLGQLAGGIAHDFNNLLSIIINFANFVAEATEGEVHEDVHEITVAAEAAARLTRQLLIFARRQPVELQSLDLNAVVDDIHGLLARSIGEDVQLVVRFSDLPAIAADRGQTEQILVNLAVNARDAMPDGGTLTIETHIAELDDEYVDAHPDAKPGSYVRLSVSDTGSGMPASVAARAFEPFFTTKAEGTGTGLGLATIYGIVTQAGGTVNLYTEEDVGTTIRVYFPIAADSVTSELRRPVADRQQGHGERVLVVEDHPAVRALTERMLTRNGYVVAQADSPDDATTLASDSLFDLLLTDVVMPGMSGRDLFERLRAVHPEQRVLFMSGYSEGVLGPTRALDEGVALIQKPFTEAALLDAVHAALRSA